MKNQVYKGETLTRTKVKNNILKIWDQANDEDKFDWYQDAHDFSIDASADSWEGLSVIQVCGVISALSPMVSWNRNLELVALALTYHQNGKTHFDMPCLKANAKKAWDIMSLLPSENKIEDKILAILRGDKVSSFFLNILYPDQAISITIDRHALSICLGQWLTDEQMRTMTPKQYLFFEECYRWTAVKLGVNPLLLQSATWVVWRKIKKSYK